MIKVLSILQPWASLSVLGHKKIETRSWNTKYRGELYIHASKKWTQQLYDTIIDIGAGKYLAESGFVFTHINKGVMSTNIPLGAIIGKVDLIETFNLDIVQLDTIINHSEELYGLENVKDIKTFHDAVKKEEAFGDYSENRFGWLLANPVMFDKEIPAKGQLGIWNTEFIGYE